LVDDDALDHSTILAKAYGVLESGTILDVECCRLDEYRETRFSVLYFRLADNRKPSHLARIKKPPTATSMAVIQPFLVNLAP
jgi:hypothetical protein